MVELSTIFLILTVLFMALHVVLYRISFNYKNIIDATQLNYYVFLSLGGKPIHCFMSYLQNDSISILIKNNESFCKN